MESLLRARAASIDQGEKHIQGICVRGQPGFFMGQLPSSYDALIEESYLA
jgi:hypothetical protein